MWIFDKLSIQQPAKAETSCNPLPTAIGIGAPKGGGATRSLEVNLGIPGVESAKSLFFGVDPGEG